MYKQNSALNNLQEFISNKPRQSTNKVDHKLLKLDGNILTI